MTAWMDAVNTFSTLTLDEVNQTAALQTRVDRKYIVTPHTWEAVLASLHPASSVLEIDGLRSFHYSSTYYDTPELDSYRDAARRRPRRFKVRTRHYLDTGARAIEVKLRSLSGTTSKSRRWLEADACARSGSLPGEAAAFVGGFTLIGDKVHELTEVLTTSYERVTLVTPDARVTVDRDVAAADAGGQLLPEAPGDQPADHYIYDPDDPVPTLGGNHSICWPDAYDTIQPGPFDQRSIEAREDVLTYTTPPLDRDIEATGPVAVHVYAATDGPDPDWTAKLVDVCPDGRAINLTEGIIRARSRKSIYEPPELLEPGKAYEYIIELQPTSNVFLEAHCVRLDVSSSNFPLWDRNPNTGHVHGRDAELRVARQTILHDRQHPSRLVLPAIPAPDVKRT